MESVIFKIFEALFKTVGVLLVCGLMATVLGDLQGHAVKSKRLGLASMLQVNQQLVGKLPGHADQR